jgi:hypothetical protein
MPKVAIALLAIVIAPATVRANGELGPMFGGSIVATHGEETDVAGVGAEVVFWYGRIGIAAEASHQWSVDAAEGPQISAVSGSLRLLAFDHIVPSLLDTREVIDLGIELHGVVERAWFDDLATHRDSYGLGLAIRLRGANDDDRSNLLTESRFFVRVLESRRDDAMATTARDTSPSSRTSGVSVIIGLGALFGGGQPAYVEQLRRRNALDAESVLGI